MARRQVQQGTGKQSVELQRRLPLEPAGGTRGGLTCLIWTWRTPRICQSPLRRPPPPVPPSLPPPSTGSQYHVVVRVCARVGVCWRDFEEGLVCGCERARLLF